MLTVVNFSGRVNGNCGQIAQVIQGRADDVKIVHFEGTCCGGCDYTCLRGGFCPKKDGVAELYQRIVESELTVFVVPNYCGYPCANFFAFNERGCGYFGGREDRLRAYLAAKKKFIAVSNSNADHFKEAFRYHVPEGEEPDVLCLSTKKFGCNSLDGNLMEQEVAANWWKLLSAKSTGWKKAAWRWCCPEIRSLPPGN